jgi:hypothetical protein
MHWNGTQWNVVPSPNPGIQNWFQVLRDVRAVSATDVWAVGFYYIEPEVSRVLILHWDGTQWTQVSTPNVVTNSNYLNDLAVVSADDIWAVGHAGNTNFENQPLVMHWNGTQWSIVPGPTFSSAYNALSGVASIGRNMIWAVGTISGVNGGLNSRTLLEYYGGRFTDVLPGNPFYPYVTCLACSSIISGYSDDTFRPNASVTRGQLSKIVSNAAGWNDDPGSQIFEDVPPGDTFYVWVQRIALRGYIGGYTCGGPREPCRLPANMPYFRPRHNATRGQVAKIVSSAAGHNEPITGQHYEDVPENNPFYIWIMRLTNRGVMTGYPCGLPGEPCGPGNRPYFRWSRDTTRGQTAQIVGNTFFPNCQIARAGP